LQSFSCAQALDPTWEAPQEKEKQLVKYLDSVQELVDLKGKMKVKKLQQMVQVRSGHVWYRVTDRNGVAPWSRAFLSSAAQDISSLFWYPGVL
jgi:hypothetical protein